MPNGALAVPRLEVLGVSFESDQAYLILLSAVFALLAIVVVLIRRGEFGRRLQAMKTSPAACTTLGLNLTMTKLQVFALSAGIAGLGGALYGGQLTSVSPDRFQFLQSLPVVLLAVSGGIGAVGGALFGGITYALFFFIIPDLYPSLTNFFLLAPGLLGISLGRNPNGAVNEIAKSFREAVAKRQAKAAGRAEPTLDLDRLGLDEDFSDEDLRLIDHELGLDEVEGYAELARTRGGTG